jgi:putative FmdB family regulatory protein
MPIFEYRCASCRHEFEQLVLASRVPPSCPTCGGLDLERLLSLFAVDSADMRQRHRDHGRKLARRDLSDQKHAEMEAVIHHHREHEH